MPLTEESKYQAALVKSISGADHEELKNIRAKRMVDMANPKFFYNGKEIFPETVKNPWEKQDPNQDMIERDGRLNTSFNLNEVKGAVENDKTFRNLNLFKSYDQADAFSGVRRTLIKIKR